MVDEEILARKVAAVRDAVERIRSFLPVEAESLEQDRTVREVVALNLFVAIQESLSLATHWISDAGRQVPESYGEVFKELAGEGIIPEDLSRRLAAAAGLRNLIAHQYGVMDWRRIHAVASNELDDLLSLCSCISEAAEERA